MGNSTFRIKFKARKKTGKLVSGEWQSEERVHQGGALKVAERLVGEKLTYFIFTVKEEKLTMVKCAEE